MPNLFEPEWDQQRDEPPFRWRRARVGRQAGAEKLGASVFEVPAGASAFPMHAHLANEELMIVLAGAPTLLTLEGERQLAAGDVVSFPAGGRGAHRVDNRSEAPVRFLTVSTMLAPEVNLMPEDGTYWVRDYAPGRDPDEGSLDVRLRPPEEPEDE